MVLTGVAPAVLYTVFLWWFSTGAILWLDRLPRRTYRWSLGAAMLAAVAAVFGLVWSLDQATPFGALAAFSCTLMIWGLHELSFLTGVVTGPRTSPCPPRVSGWRRFGLAASTLIYHEIALAATAAALLALSWGRPNPVGALMFLILLLCRLSSKLNLFLGVPNFTDSFLPEHLRHLTSYMRRGPVNALFPLSVAFAGLLAGLSAWRALAADAPPFEVTAFRWRSP